MSNKPWPTDSRIPGGSRKRPDKEAELREREKIDRESSDRYRRLIDSINRTRDADIEKALRG